MKLKELNPKWDNESEEKHYFTFDCPGLHEMSAGKCVICLPVKTDNGWKVENENFSFDELTVSPSIWHHCTKDPHFFIRNGEIINA